MIVLVEPMSIQTDTARSNPLAIDDLWLPDRIARGIPKKTLYKILQQVWWCDRSLNRLLHSANKSSLVLYCRPRATQPPLYLIQYGLGMIVDTNDKRIQLQGWSHVHLHPTVIGMKTRPPSSNSSTNYFTEWPRKTHPIFLPNMEGPSRSINMFDKINPSHE